MNRVRRVAAAVLALLLGGSVAAQAQTPGAVITGRVVSDAGQPLSNANVFITELSISVGTNADGSYRISVPAARATGQEVTIRARVFGYTPAAQTIRLAAGDQTVNFTLNQDINRLSAVVITGVTGATEATKLPFSVTQVTEADMPVPGTSVLSQLQGRAPGLSILSTSGRPGSSPSVLLRGPQSINGFGRGQQPLYIIDGIVISGGLPDLNPQDIESVEIVKGAAASSLYGSRAGSGVIQITTKSGKNAGEGVRFNARVEYGAGGIESEYRYARAHFLQMDETRQFFCREATNCGVTIDFERERRRVNEEGGDFSLSPANFERDGGLGKAPSKAALRSIFQAQRWPVEYDPMKQALTSSQFLSSNIDAQGRFGGTSFFVSGGNFSQENQLRYVKGYVRNNFRLNLDQQVGSDWKFGVRTLYTNSTNNGIDHEEGTAFFRLTRQPVGIDMSTRDRHGRLYIRSNPLSLGGQNQNPLYVAESWTSQTDIERFLGNFTANYQPLSWLDLDGSLSYDRATNRYFFLQDKGYRTTAQSSLNDGTIQRNAGVASSYNGSLNAVSRHTFRDDLNTRFNLRYLYEQQDGVAQQAWGDKLCAPGLTTLTCAGNQAGINIRSQESSVRSIGLMAGADMDWKERYILGVLLRRDGSSLFGVDNRWANYGRASAAWRISEEPWWFTSAVNELKFRGSVGTAGGRPGFAAQYETFAISPGTGGLSASTLGNRNLRPETVTETEVGFDAEILNRYGITVNYAHSLSKDQILPVPPSVFSGFTNQWRNAGTLENNTWEASVNIPILQRRNLTWSTRVNYDRNRTTVKQLDVPEFFIGTNQQAAEAMFKIAEGERYGNFYGRRLITSCSELPASFASQCGGAGSAYQRNNDGYIVYVGQGNSLGEGITRNLWQAERPGCVNPTTGAALGASGEVACAALNGVVNAPWGRTVGWGLPIVRRDSTGTAKQSLAGNALPDYRASMSHSFNYRRFFVFGLFEGVFGRDVFNQGRHWSLGDFSTGEVDQLGRSVEDAKPIGYYWRTTDHSAGVGGLYDALGVTSHTVEDASFVKLREVNLSYNVGPVRSIGDWTVSLIGRNLKTWTNYRGFDPEVGHSGTSGISNTNSQSGSAQINALDAYTFPNMRTFTFSVSTRF
jgi:TonB-linked SusC/RagA family outer membrane protein